MRRRNFVIFRFSSLERRDSRVPKFRPCRTRTSSACSGENVLLAITALRFGVRSRITCLHTLRSMAAVPVGVLLLLAFFCTYGDEHPSLHAWKVAMNLMCSSIYSAQRAPLRPRSAVAPPSGPSARPPRSSRRRGWCPTRRPRMARCNRRCAYRRSRWVSWRSVGPLCVSNFSKMDGCFIRARLKTATTKGEIATVVCRAQSLLQGRCCFVVGLAYQCAAEVSGRDRRAALPSLE